MNQRYTFIDLLRFLAVIFMIQGHVFDALLDPQIKTHPSFYLYDFLHGFTAPAFLFASGIAYGIATFRNWDEHIMRGERSRARIRRFVGLIAVGYALHLPYFSLWKTITQGSAAEFRALLQSDVLQCLGVTLLLLQFAVLLSQRVGVFQKLVATTATGVIFLSPIFWSAQLGGILPAPVVAYLTPENGSWFPLFPWSAYILCGSLLGLAVGRTTTSSEAAAVMAKTVALSAFTLVVAWLSMQFTLYPQHDFWKSNPTMFFVRLAVICMIAAGIFFAQRWLHWDAPVPVRIGRESLLIYIVHLLVVYGSVINRGLAQRIGPALSISEASAVFLVVLSATIGLAMFWHYWKAGHAASASRATRIAAAAFVVAFVLRPW